MNLVGFVCSLLCLLSALISIPTLDANLVSWPIKLLWCILPEILEQTVALHFFFGGVGLGVSHFICENEVFDVIFLIAYFNHLMYKLDSLFLFQGNWNWKVDCIADGIMFI